MLNLNQLSSGIIDCQDTYKKLSGPTLKVKNIKNGGFYLIDNEIARIEKSETHLILVDIDNGIWLLNDTLTWLKNDCKY